MELASVNESVEVFNNEHNLVLANTNINSHSVVNRLRLLSTNDHSDWEGAIFSRYSLKERVEIERVQAIELRQRNLPPRTWFEWALEKIEKQWAPAREDMPPKITPEMAGNSSEAYFKPAIYTNDYRSRQARIDFINRHAHSWNLTDWSSVFENKIPIAKLPRQLEGMTILHISDLHVNCDDPSNVDEIEALAEWARTSQRTIDLVVFTGDILTKSPADLCLRTLKALKTITDHAARAYFVLGNHDYHGHRPLHVVDMMGTVGFKTLLNATERLLIDGAVLNISGVDDAYHGMPIPPPNLKEYEINILLAHNLDAVRANYPGCLDLILSGHTHHGEIQYIDGTKLMSMWGYCDNKNGQIAGWKMLNNRTISGINPGVARYYVKIPRLMQPAGFMIHTLTAFN